MSRSRLAAVLAALAAGCAGGGLAFTSAEAQVPCSTLSVPGCTPTTTTSTSTTTTPPSTTTTPPTQTTPPPPPPPISAEAYATLTPFFDAQAGKSFATYAKACRALTSGASVVTSFFKTCRTDLTANTAGGPFSTCKGFGPCKKATTRFYAALSRQLSAYRTANTTLAKEVPDPECRAALQQPKADLTLFARYVTAIGTLKRAFTERSPALAKKAGRMLDKIDFSKNRGAKAQFTAFQAGCRA